jgi:hypothetical protein
MEEIYKNHISNSFENAENDTSKITQEIIDISGMSGRKTRHFYNNLLNFKDARYLEIGTWKGSSVCSAMCGNNAKVVCVDNWSLYDGPKEEFLENYEKHKGQNDATFIEDDCFDIDVSKLSKFNIYMYDGCHLLESHYKALVHYIDCLDDIFIYVVDDWNWRDVREGTMQAIHLLDLKIISFIEKKTTNNDCHSIWGSKEQVEWHNGMATFVLQKTS